MTAAIRASQLGQDVTLIEKNSVLGRKLLLSGKGRCNLTNACDLDSFLGRFSKNGQFLRDAFKVFSNLDLIDFFQKRGLKLKTERDQRVFPVTDKADSVLQVLKKELHKNRVEIVYNSRIKDILVDGRKVKGVTFGENKFIAADRIILASGGVSYSFTGSGGDGLEIAKRLGHNIVSLRPGLIPLEVKQPYPEFLEGLALGGIRLKFSDGRRQIFSDRGELLFTKSGISGPLVLSLSGKAVDWLAENKNLYVEIDLQPDLSKEELNIRLLRESRSSPKKSIKNMLKNFLPQRLANLFMDIVRIPTDKNVSQITQKERKEIISLLKGLRLDIARPRPTEEAMITRGGISLKDINPRTMESRLVKNLYFAGEMIDVDADTGGFNLQAAFSTGYLAGQSAASTFKQINTN